MLDESNSEESTNLMRTIVKTLERLASQEYHDEHIPAYCKKNWVQNAEVDPTITATFPAPGGQLVDHNLAIENSTNRHFTYL